MGVRISIKHGDIASQVAVNRIIETLFGRGYARLRTAFYISTVLAAQLVVRCVNISAGHVGDLERIICRRSCLKSRGLVHRKPFRVGHDRRTEVGSTKEASGQPIVYHVYTRKGFANITVVVGIFYQLRRLQTCQGKGLIWGCTNCTSFEFVPWTFRALPWVSSIYHGGFRAPP